MTVPAHLRVALYTDDTHPQAHGGMDMWSDRLVRGLSEHRFSVITVTGTGQLLDGQPVGGQPSASPAAPLPENATLTPLPLWGEPLRPVRSGRARVRATEEAYERLLEAMFSLVAYDFGAALRRLSALGLEGSFDRGLGSAYSVRRTLETWTEAARLHRGVEGPRLPRPSVADALEVNSWLTRALRPLAFTPPDADLGHAVGNGLPGLLALHGLWQRGTPFVLTEQDIFLRERYLEFRGSDVPLPFKAMLLRFYRLLGSVSYRHAALILPGSHHDRRWEERLGAEPERIVPVYSGVDPQLFPAAPDEPQEPVVSWVGDIGPLKDLETLIRAFALVQHRLPAARLRLFGDVPAGNEAYFRACQSLVSDLKLEGSVTFEARAGERAEPYRAAQVVALSSVSEGFPSTVTESMAVGRPPVATRVGGVPEVIGDTGIVVRPRDAFALSNALLRLLSDADLRHTLGQAARARVLALFTPEGCLRAYRSAYRAALTGPAEPGLSGLGLSGLGLGTPAELTGAPTGAGALTVTGVRAEALTEALTEPPTEALTGPPEGEKA